MRETKAPRKIAVNKKNNKHSFHTLFGSLVTHVYGRFHDTDETYLELKEEHIIFVRFNTVQLIYDILCVMVHGLNKTFPCVVSSP